MRTAALTLLSFVAFGYAAKAQKFNLLPQVGFENSKTNIRVNNLPSFSPGGVIFTPQVSLQLNYKSKPGHGFFVGASTSRYIVPFRFADPGDAMNSFTTNTGKLQLRLEGGYQFSSKPIYFKKQTKAVSETVMNKTVSKKSCGSSYSFRSKCPGNKVAPNNITRKSIAQYNKGTWVRFQPSIGIGYMPIAKDHLVNVNEMGNSKYEYRAGNMRTAVLSGVGFEFGKNDRRQFTINVNYLRSIGNKGTQHITSLNGTKTVTTQLRSNVTGWNLKMGVPFTLGAKKAVLKQPASQKVILNTQRCQQYRIRYKCSRTL